MGAGLAQKPPSLLHHVLPVTTVQQSRIWTTKESFRRLLEADISRQKKKKKDYNWSAASFSLQANSQNLRASSKTEVSIWLSTV